MDETCLTEAASPFTAPCNLDIEAVMNHLHIRDDGTGGEERLIDIGDNSFTNFLPLPVQTGDIDPIQLRKEFQKIFLLCLGLFPPGFLPLRCEIANIENDFFPISNDHGIKKISNGNWIKGERTSGDDQREPFISVF